MVKYNLSILSGGLSLVEEKTMEVYGNYLPREGEAFRFDSDPVRREYIVTGVRHTVFENVRGIQSETEVDIMPSTVVKRR